jgi:hypothetical protein
MKTLILFSLVTLSGLLSKAPESIKHESSSSNITFPVPDNIPNLLFYLQRNRDANTICYILNVKKDGTVNTKDPVHVFWKLYEDGGAIGQLSYLQKKFAYGVNVKETGNAMYEIRSVALPDRPLILKQNSKNKYEVHASLLEKECLLSRIFIKIDGGTLLSPNVKYIELMGKDLATGKTITERISVDQT